MPNIVVSSDCWKAVREFLADVEGMSIGEFVEACVMYACESMENPLDESFEDHIDLEGEGESEEEEEEEEEEPDEEEFKSKSESEEKEEAE